MKSRFTTAVLNGPGRIAVQERTLLPPDAGHVRVRLVCSPWSDTERIFSSDDFLTVRTGREMIRELDKLLTNERRRQHFARHGLSTMRGRHTCAHRVDQLMDIYSEIISAAAPKKKREPATINPAPSLAPGALAPS